MKELLLFTHSQALINHWMDALSDSSISVMQESKLYQVLDADKRQVILYDMQSFSEIFPGVIAEAKRVNTPLFVLTGRPTFKEGSALLGQGICGYGNSYMAAGNLQLALEVAVSGNVWLYPEFIQQLIVQASIKKVKPGSLPALHVLTPKELEVAQCVAQGMTNKEVGIKLFITERTTKAHLTHIYEKLNISDRLTLALMLKDS